MCIGKNSVYGVQYCPWLQISTRGPGSHPSWIKGITIITQVDLGCTRLISWLRFLICCQFVLDMWLHISALSLIGKSSMGGPSNGLLWTVADRMLWESMLHVYSAVYIWTVMLKSGVHRTEGGTKSSYAFLHLCFKTVFRSAGKATHTSF